MANSIKQDDDVCLESSSKIEKSCPEPIPLGGESESATMLLDKLKKEMDAELSSPDSILKTNLEQLKSMPSDLEKAYMSIPKIVAYYRVVKDGIPNSQFSDFGGLGALEDLYNELSKCTEKLPQKSKAAIDHLRLNVYGQKQDQLKKNYRDAKEESQQVFSCVDAASEWLKQKKGCYCILVGDKYMDGDKEEPIEICQGIAESDAGSSRVTAARISWLGGELVRMFKALGITEAQGKKGSFSCDILPVSKIVMYAYSLEIKYIIEKLKDVENEQDAKFKSDLDSAWREWIKATHCYFKLFEDEKKRRKSLDQSESELKEFLETREEKFVRDAQDVEGADCI
ncbi:MAG: hypothetical protein DHS20C01_31320 [marine bacterium B5-7]|nr:MAG: hypothetical protein DHS20C01_31320 [marine bacterium B5-7]